MVIGDKVKIISNFNRNGNDVNLLVNSLQKGKTQSREGQKGNATKNGLKLLQELQNITMNVKGIFFLPWRTESQHLLPQLCSKRIKGFSSSLSEMIENF